MKFDWLSRQLPLLAVICSAPLFAAPLQDYFKPAPNKTGACAMRNIDFVYMINLDQRPEKFSRSSQQLILYGVFPYRFSAVNGWELPLETVLDVGVQYQRWMSLDKLGTCYFFGADGEEQREHGELQEEGMTYFCHCMTRGAIGIALSHLSVLQDAYDSGYETIWVMEDDIEILENIDVLPDLIDQLDVLVGKGEWDILFTDRDTRNDDGISIPCASFAARPNYKPSDPARFAEKVEISSEIRQIGARYGAYSMIVRRSGMKKILDFLKTYQIFLPFDMEFTQPDDIHLYGLTRDVVSIRPGSPSDNGCPNYLERK